MYFIPFGKEELFKTFKNKQLIAYNLHLDIKNIEKLILLAR